MPSPSNPNPTFTRIKQTHFWEYMQQNHNFIQRSSRSQASKYRQINSIPTFPFCEHVSSPKVIKEKGGGVQKIIFWLLKKSSFTEMISTLEIISSKHDFRLYGVQLAFVTLKQSLQKTISALILKSSFEVTDLILNAKIDSKVDFNISSFAYFICRFIHHYHQFDNYCSQPQNSFLHLFHWPLPLSAFSIKIIQCLFSQVALPSGGYK